MPGKLAIDFGTSNTVLARWDQATETGIPFHIPDYGHQLNPGQDPVSVIPSLIHYTNDKRQWIGHQVLANSLQKSDRTFRWMKRYIGSRNGIKRRFGDRQVSHFDAGKDFLSTVLLFAASDLNLDPTDEVAFTIPVEAFEHYEAWLTDVAQAAGMPRIRLIDEPSAAALGYGAHIQPGDVYLIFDFGGGTLDVAVVLIDEDDASSSRRCRILGKAGLDLGGTTIDQWLFQNVLRQTGYSDADDEIRAVSQAILVECEQAKIQLSHGDRADVSIFNPHTGTVLNAEFTRSQFEDLLDDNEALTRLNQTLRRALNDARERGFTEADIKAVLMVGGSSQIPVIQSTIKRIFGKDRVLLHRPLDAVARGAAAFVAGVDFFDHIQHDYAIRFRNSQTGEFDYRPLVQRGTTYPSDGPLVSLTIKASHDDQHQLGLAIFEEGTPYRRSEQTTLELVFDPSGAARLSNVNPATEAERHYFWMNENSPTFLSATPPVRKGDACFRVEFAIDANKRLLMTALDIKGNQLTHLNYPVIKLT
ncbi:MAG: Hsp70 family protein [Synechocystis sp.]